MRRPQLTQPQTPAPAALQKMSLKSTLLLKSNACGMPQPSEWAADVPGIPAGNLPFPLHVGGSEDEENVIAAVLVHHNHIVPVLRAESVLSWRSS